MGDYPDYEPFNRMKSLDTMHVTAVPLSTVGRLTGFLILASRRNPNLSSNDESLLEKLAPSSP